MIYSLARDGLLPKAMKQLDPKTRIPKNATLVAGSMAAIAGGVFPLASIASFLNICTLAYLVMLAFALLKLRKEHGAPGPGEFKNAIGSSLANPVDCGLSVLYDPVFPIDLAGLRSCSLDRGRNLFRLWVSPFRRKSIKDES